MRRYILLSLVSVLSLSASRGYAGDEPATTSCEALGYTTPYNDCIRANGMPLICPFYSLDKKMVLCMKESCRGYSLTDADLDAQASDGKKVREHISSTESCTVGYGNDAKTYYRVKECKSGSLYQNGICDVGCLQARYPYNQHPGDLAGEVEMCVDTAGKWYGYYTCNQGWVGGWRDSQNGECKFATCSIYDYPYSSDPNINKITGESLNRGETLTCKIGRNTYYRYTAVDKDGNQLTSNVCGISNSYTLSRGVCRKQCVFDNCTSSLKNTSLSGYTFSYNEWTCTQKTNDCRVGDMVTINNAEIGMIVHLPTSSTDRLRLIYNSVRYGAFMSGARYSEENPLPNTSTYDGKYNSKFILKYKEQRNNEVTTDKYSFPMFEAVATFSPSECNSPICYVGEWYIPAVYECLYIKDNKYILYNAANDSNFTWGQIISSDDFYGPYSKLVFLSGQSADGGLTIDGSKTGSYRYFPMLSFYVR